MTAAQESADRGLAEAVARALTADARLPSASVGALIDSFGLDGPDPVLLAALPHAVARADPPISGFRVGAVGLEAESGDVLLGWNLEFPGAELGRTVHAEGAVAVRSFLRGTSISTLAVREARPCAFCRQILAEFAWGPGLRVIDPLGQTRTLEDLYPWPFTPDGLGVTPAGPTTRAPLPTVDAGTGASPAWAELGLRDDPAVPAEVVSALLAAGRSAHAPYSACPAAVALRCRDGTLIAGRTLESVAFDPTMGPLQVALVALRASGRGYADIDAAWLASFAGGAVDDVGPTRHLLSAIAPDVRLIATTWT